MKDFTIRAENAKTSVMEKLKYDKGYEERLGVRKKENEVLHQNVLGYKTAMHAKQAQFEQDLAANTRKRNPFIAKVNEKSLAQATAYKNKKEMQMAQIAAYEEAINERTMGLMDDYDGMDDIQAKLEMEV